MSHLDRSYFPSWLPGASSAVGRYTSGTIPITCTASEYTRIAARRRVRYDNAIPFHGRFTDDRRIYRNRCRAGVTRPGARQYAAAHIAPRIDDNDDCRLVQRPKIIHIDPIAVALAAATVTADEKTQIDVIVEKYQKERDTIVPPPAAGEAAAEPPRWTPPQRAQLDASEAKEVTEIKAVLSPDQQTKFQTAYDTAKITEASTPILAFLTDKLTLTEDELTKVTPIVTDFTQQSLKLRQDTTLDRDARRTKMNSLWDDTKVKIRPLLTPDQQTTLDTLTLPRGSRPGGAAPTGAPTEPATAPPPPTPPATPPAPPAP